MSAGVRARGEDVSFRDVKIRIPESKCDFGLWMTSCTGSVRGGFWEIWEKSVGFLRPRKTVDFRSPPGPCGGCRTLFQGRWKSQHRKIVSRSPYVEKPLNSKVIKSFVPELRSRKCFSCFRIPMLSIYELWTFYVHFTYSWMALLHHTEV